NGRADERRPDRAPIHPEIDARRPISRIHRDKQPGKLRFYQPRPAGGLLASRRVPVLGGQRRRHVEGAPRTRRLAVLLLAVAQVQERSRAWIELLAGLELGAGLGILAFGEEAPSFAEERLRSGSIRGAWFREQRGGQEEDGRRDPRGEAADGW